MNSKHHRGQLSLSLILSALALPLITQAGQPPTKQHSRYKLIDLGTLGGPASSVAGEDQSLNNAGTVVGGADTCESDPFNPKCYSPNCFVRHAFLWQNGVLTDLGTLPGGATSDAIFINARGGVVGLSQNGLTDPLTGAPEYFGVVWKNGQIINLGTLGGNGSIAVGINTGGQVIGSAANTIPDPFSLSGIVGGPGFGNQTRAFLWKNSAMTDLGNLGITSAAHAINSKGQVVGASRVSFEGTQANAFLWDNGGPMIDLNTQIPPDSALHLVFAEHINDRGEIAGTGLPPGVPFEEIDSRGHAFLLIPVGTE